MLAANSFSVSLSDVLLGFNAVDGRVLGTNLANYDLVISSTDPFVDRILGIKTGAGSQPFLVASKWLPS